MCKICRCTIPIAERGFRRLVKVIKIDALGPSVSEFRIYVKQISIGISVITDVMPLWQGPRKVFNLMPL